MTREDRIKQCRYYKGEKDFPENLEGIEVGFWIAEKFFVSAEERGGGREMMLWVCFLSLG